MRALRRSPLVRADTHFVEYKGNASVPEETVVI